MHTKNIFGTDGIRAHSESEILQPRALASLGYALGKWASSKYESPRIIIARDTRQSGTKIQKGLLSGLLAHPVMLYDSGILPTPATYTLMHHRDLFDIALIISASHNPYQDNGIKIFNKKSIKLTAAEELTISSMLSDPITHDKDKGIIKPFPEQLVHACAYMKNPCLKCISPDPLQVAHVCALVPARAPEPLHASQAK